jgi:hypothetical protein
MPSRELAYISQTAIREIPLPQALSRIRSVTETEQRQRLLTAMVTLLPMRVSGDPVSGKNSLFYMHSDHLGSNSVMSYGQGYDVYLVGTVSFFGRRRRCCSWNLL